MLLLSLLPPLLCVVPRFHRRDQLTYSQDSDPDKVDRAKLVEILTAPYIEDSGDGIVALDPHALKKLFTTTSNLLQVTLLFTFVQSSPPSFCS